MPLRTLLGLIACNIVWSAHPLMGKYLLESFGAAQAAWLRYASALLAYVLAAIAVRAGTGTPRSFFLRPKSSRDWFLLTALGFSAFCASPILQLTGLASSRAADNALIVAMEPLLATVLAWVLIGERPTPRHLGAFAMALTGFMLLTGSRGGQAVSGWDPRWIANCLIFFSLFGEALYSSLSRKLIDRFPLTAVFGSALAIGVMALTLATWLGPGFPAWPQVISATPRSWLALLWLGPLGTTLSYLYWLAGLRKAPIASVSLTLFVQPLLGPLWGMAFLGERLTEMQWIGSGLILIAVLTQATLHFKIDPAL